MEITYNGKRYTPSSTAKEIYASDEISDLIKYGIVEEIKEEKPDIVLPLITKGKISTYSVRDDKWTDHDKAMDETHGVMDVVEVKKYNLEGDFDDMDYHIETLTKAVLQLQSHVFNK